MKSIIALTLIAVQICFAQSNKLSLLNDYSANTQSFIHPYQISDESSEKKNVATAVLYSLLLPGMGEMYADNYGRGKYFTVAEGVLWITFLGYDLYGNWLQDDARNFASQHAGVSLSGQGDKYFIDIGNFQNVQDYNQDVLRNRESFKLYNENSVYAWNWDSRANRELYRDQRISSDRMFNNTHFVAAAIVVNHIISAIDAAMLVISHNKNISQEKSFDIHADPIGGVINPSGIMITLTKTF